MTNLQRLQLRASEIRSRLAELGGTVDQTDETRAEIETLRTEYQDVETRSQALMIAGDEPQPRQDDAEHRELAQLERRASVGMIFDSVVNSGRRVDGETAELQQHLDLGANQVPISLIAGSQWETRDEGGELETRAVTPAPSNVGQNQQPVIPYVFPQSVGAFLGVDMPTVGVGESVFPVLTSELSVGAPAENATQAETTGAFSAEVLSPARLQASFFYSREDRASFAGMDAALRQNLNEGLMDALDDQIISGTNGLLTGTNLANHAASAVTTFANYIDQFAYGRVDGRYAANAGDIRLVMGSAAYAHAGETYRNTNVDRTALDRLMEIVAGIRVSAHVPAESSNKQNQIIRRGARRDMVAPIWEGITLIPDEVTKADEGQIKITAVMLHAVKILRADGFYKQETQHAT